MSRPKRRRRALDGFNVWNADADFDVVRTVREEERRSDAELISLAVQTAERALDAGDVALAAELVSLGEALYRHLEGAR